MVKLKDFVLCPYLQARIEFLLLTLMRKICRFPAVNNPPGSTTWITREKPWRQPQKDTSDFTLTETESMGLTNQLKQWIHLVKMSVKPAVLAVGNSWHFVRNQISQLSWKELRRICESPLIIKKGREFLSMVEQTKQAMAGGSYV